MTILIIDDEPLARNLIKEYLSSYGHAGKIIECSDGFEGFKAIQQNSPDLIFLDIQMPRINGFEMLELIDEPPAVIFTTAFDEFAIKAFESNAIDYLLKPFSRERFDKSYAKFLQHTLTPATTKMLEPVTESSVHQNRIVVKDGAKIKIIPISQVQFLEAADDYVKIVTMDGTYLKKQTMAFFEQTLPQQQFIRIHRSYIVNTLLITKIEAYEKDSHTILLNSGASLPVSKSGYSKLKEVLGI